MEKKNKKIVLKNTKESPSDFKVLIIITCGVLILFAIMYNIANHRPIAHIVTQGTNVSNSPVEVPEMVPVVSANMNAIDEEIRLIDLEIAKNPTAGLYFNKGVAYLNSFRYQDCIDTFTKSLEMDSSNSYAYLNRAYCLSSLSKYQEALNDLNKGLEINPNDYLLKERKIQVEESLK